MMQLKIAKSRIVNVYVYSLACEKCPRCGASSAWHSVNYSKVVEPASFGIYIRGKRHVVFHACGQCVNSALQTHLLSGVEYKFINYASSSLPEWLWIAGK